ncbi:MAG: argininosuccinate lyase [Saprospiraceae bacterium]|nr:argininosuccinate lyase [Saprospiraceae bacterium]
MKLWQKEATATHEAVEQFTVGRDREMDLRLAPFDILGSLAHIKMLSEVGLLDSAEQDILATELRRLYSLAVNDKFEITEGVEDVHSQVEFLLTETLGDMGKRIHSARSRNDQVLVDLKLFFRAEIRSITEGVSELFDTLMALSEKHKNVLMPGYTHLQVAMPSSFGLWFGAYAETLTDDLQLWQAVFKIANQNPLGSAAGYGSSLPISRQRTTELLGFDDLNYNVVAAQIGRGKTEQFVAFGLAAFGATLSKLSMDICLFINQNFDFVGLPPTLTTGSSIMPHKKNPDVFELIRARANRLQSLPSEVALLTSNLPSGYHRDFQMLKEVIFPALDEVKNLIAMTEFMVKNLIIKKGILNDKKYQYLFSVEEVNRLVTNGVPFRDAYKIVGDSIENGTFAPDKKVKHTHEGSIGNLSNAKIKAKKARILRGYNFEKMDVAITNLVVKN